MADPFKVPREELTQVRDMSAATYLSAYVQLVCEELGVDASDRAAVNGLVLAMVEPLNHATEAMWRALMEDLVGKEQAITGFKASLNRLGMGSATQ